MYADQLEAQATRSVKDRLNGDIASGAGGRRPISGKRPREDDYKWEHDLFEDGKSPVLNRRIDVKDLRLKLQKKGVEQTKQSSRGSVSGFGGDLREKLSGTLYSRPAETKPPPAETKPHPVRKNPEVNKPTRKSVITQTPNPETNETSDAAKRKVQQKVDSVDNFLELLGLEKYSITFQAEEVDMTALVHMRDDDLKALGIPMGPRKKILLALESKSID